MNKIFLIALLTANSFILAQSSLANIYCSIFGDTDIKQEYKELVHTALSQYGIANPADVPVKKMNNVGPLIALMPLSSFTAFGIWFNEDRLDSCTHEDRIFQIYHEVGHYVQCHHQKLIATEVAMAVTAAVGLRSLYTALKKYNNPYALSLTVGGGIASLLAIYLGISPYIVKQQEKEADIKACQKLIALGSNEIISHRIASLRASESEGKLWWFSNKEQADYLEDASK